MVQIFLKTGQDYESKFLSLDASESNDFLFVGMGTKWKKREGTEGTCQLSGKVYCTAPDSWPDGSLMVRPYSKGCWEVEPFILGCHVPMW